MDYGEVIPGHEKYSITRDAKVWKNSEHLCRENIDAGGYHYVYVDGKKEYLHKLLAITYLPAPKDTDERVYFKDKNKDNLSIDNLYWSDYNYVKEPNKIVVNYLVEVTSGIRFDEEPTHEGIIAEEKQTTFNTMAECAEFFGVGRRSVSASLKKNKVMPSLLEAGIISIRRMERKIY